jgi:hypothetical protein
MPFKLFDAGADIRLHPVQLDRGLGNAALGRDCAKNL